MSDAPEGAVRWFLRYVFVPLAVVIVGAGATYYFANRDDTGGYSSADAQTDEVSMTAASATEAGAPQGAVPGTSSGTVPPPPTRTFDSGATRMPDGSVVVAPPTPMGNRTAD